LAHVSLSAIASGCVSYKYGCSSTRDGDDLTITESINAYYIRVYELALSAVALTFVDVKF